MSEPVSAWSEYAYLQGYDGEARPEHAFRRQINTLPDGTYEFEVVSASLGRAENGDGILTLVLRCAAGDVEYVYWLNKPRNVNGLLADLAALAFPAQRWGAGPGKTSLAVALPQLTGQQPGSPFGLLRGVRFRAMKTSRSGARPENGGPTPVYHDLYVAGRINPAAAPQAPAQGQRPGGTPPTQYAQVQRPGAPAAMQPAPPPQQPAPSYDESEIPF